MTGFSFIGIIFTDAQRWDNLPNDFLVLGFILFYVTSIYFLNAYADYLSDIHTQRLKSISKIPQSTYLILFLSFSILFCFLSIIINTTVFLLGISGSILWLIYYLPPFRLKSTFLGGTLIHFLAEILHFHSGYCCFASMSKKSILISIFFSLLLCIGHLHHEMIDYEDDKLAGNKTTTVRIGKTRVFYVRTFLSFYTAIYWCVLFYIHTIDLTFFISFIIPITIVVIYTILFKQQKTKQFQLLSRAIFFLAGFVLLILRVFNLFGYPNR